jgi:TetR/AcrR family transcriptional regulator, transcriptional repressor of bet genes
MNSGRAVVRRDGSARRHGESREDGMPGQKAPEEKRREQILNAAYQVALRYGIDGLTVRAVAARARLSHGLVIFHFKRKDQLVAALLDRVLATATMLEVSEDIAAIPRVPERVRALLEQEMARLAREPRGMRLFFEYWALGARQPAVRAKVSAALHRYRAAFRAVVEEALRAEPRHATGVTPDGVAAVAVSLINGGAVQAMIDPDRFDLAAYLAAGQGLIEWLTPVTGTRAPARGAEPTRVAVPA